MDLFHDPDFKIHLCENEVAFLKCYKIPQCPLRCVGSYTATFPLTTVSLTSWYEAPDVLRWLTK